MVNLTLLGSPTGPFSHPWFGDDKSPLSLETGSSGSRESPRPHSPLEGGGGRGAEVAEMGKRPNISSIGAGATPKSDSCEACKAFQTSHQVFYRWIENGKVENQIRHSLHAFVVEILSLSITGQIFGHFTGRVLGLGCGLEGFLGLDFIITSESFKINNIIYL